MLIKGDCLEKLKELPENSVDAVVTDPPYELGFMGKAWDKSGIAYNIELWEAVMRVLKPGGHLLSFGGSRTYHRMACAIEDAGFEIRDQIMWVYGSGFPKSLNIGKAIDKLQGNVREVVGIAREGRSSEEDWGMKPNGEVTKGNSEWEGWGTALKPANEPIVLARKPLGEKTVAENVLKWGTGGINVDGSRVEYQGQGDWDNTFRPSQNVDKNNWLKEGNHIARRDVIKSSGRFPANLIHDGSDEVVGLFPNSKSVGGMANGHDGEKSLFGIPTGLRNVNPYSGEEGSAARFFYCAKASKGERNKGLEGFKEKERIDYGGFHSEQGLINNNRNPENRKPAKNHHPTVKPISLMRYLCRLVIPKGGTVLDPFTGSGSTGIAAKLEGFDFIGIEREEDYVKIAEARISAWEANKQEVLL